MNNQTTFIQEGKKPLFQTKKFLINGILTDTINARELHAYLESGDKFADWIKFKIEQYDFKFNEEYLIRKIPNNPLTGGRPSIEYYITLDMAKELCMIQNNAKGKQARRYFIDFEKKAKILLNSLYVEHKRRIAKAEIELAIKRDYVTLLDFANFNSLNYNRFLACIAGKRSHALTEKCLLEKLGINVQNLYNKANNKLIESNLFNQGANNG